MSAPYENRAPAAQTAFPPSDHLYHNSAPWATPNNFDLPQSAQCNSGASRKTEAQSRAQSGAQSGAQSRAQSGAQSGAQSRAPSGAQSGAQSGAPIQGVPGCVCRGPDLCCTLPDQSTQCILGVCPPSDTVK